ncbi:hypothetical protein N7537_003520 [Penicillium hordei]|uniref:Uncharacterized protein n=1 Tax=Penicillium hordei TaxID=40994 RepID=A0AAD6E9K2_9EURO|nr:uncharacterized protein N7537_003520 [Penicillium hordei]KAJ5606901.1 hypothetical protein N7537_003520 [Penicillium hordei]
MGVLGFLRSKGHPSPCICQVLYVTNETRYRFCTTISATPQLFTDRISLLSIFSQPLPRQDFSTAIDSSLNLFNFLDRSIFDSRWDPSQGPSGRKFNGYQIGAFPEIRLTAPSPAPTSGQVDPLRTSDSPAERSACQCTSPPALSH